MSEYYNIKSLLNTSEEILIKIMCKLLENITPLDSLDNYRYIAFPSLTFYDFKFIKNKTPINDFICLENNSIEEERLSFNIPASINISRDTITHLLIDLPHNKKDIIWLNHKSVLSNEIIEDIKSIIHQVEAGSIFLISLDTTKPKIDLPLEDRLIPQKRKEEKERIINDFNQLILNELDIEKETDHFLEDQSIFNSKNFSTKCKKIINSHINKYLSEREDREQKGLEYKQLFNFYYTNGNKEIITIGGILFDSELKSKINECSFDNLFFIKDNNKFFNLHIPKITEKEIKYIKENQFDSEDSYNKLLNEKYNLFEIKEICNIYEYAI